MRSPGVAAVFVFVGFALGCSSGLPPRYVLERDIADYRYRRYQKVLDTELPVAGNESVSHTASYVQRDGDELRVASAVVTVYERPERLTSHVRERLRSLGTYDVRTEKRHGEWVFVADGGDDRWLVWISGRHVVKVGTSDGADIPPDLAKSYFRIYPSDVDEHGRAKKGALSAGEPDVSGDEGDDEALALPAHLREGAPRER